MEHTANHGTDRLAGMTRRSREALAPLAHPVFWGALVVLALNDHVLKGAGILPGVVTGKLSDFAGLIVAPVLLAALIPRRLVAFALITIPFALIKMSPLFAAFAEEGMALVGIEWRIWVDPTDLVALLSLPVAWWVCEASTTRVSGRGVIERAGIVLGAAACLATSAPVPPPTWSTSAYLVDWTGAPQEVRIRWIDGELDCARVAADPITALDRGMFTATGVTFSLVAGATVPLDPDAARSAAGLPRGPGSTTTAACNAALLQVEGMPDTIVFWNGLPVRRIETTVAPARSPESGAVALVARGGDVDAVGGAGIALNQGAVRLGDPVLCDAGSPQAYAWSPLAGGVTLPWYLESVTVGPDGCLAAELKDADGGAAQLDLCVPADLFPFVVGEDLTVDATATRLQMQSAHAELVGVAGTAAPPAEVGDRAYLDDIGCGGEHDPCGAYAEPLALVVPGGTRILAGGRANLPFDALGRYGVVAVGRAQRVLVSHTGCDAPRAALGTSVDLVVVRTEVAR